MASPPSPSVPMTPAMLQGVEPAWGRTPSPSPMIRMPVIADREREDHSSKASNIGPQLTQEHFLEICAPHIERMLMALYEAVESEIDRCLPPQATCTAGAPKDPFASLFDEQTGARAARRDCKQQPGVAPVQEEQEAPSSRDASPPVVAKAPSRLSQASGGASHSPRQSGGFVLRLTEEKVPSVASGGGSSSKSVSPPTIGSEPPAANQGTQTRGMQPLYLAWQGDAEGNPTRSSPVVSPLIPTTTPQPQTSGQCAFTLESVPERQSEDVRAPAPANGSGGGAGAGAAAASTASGAGPAAADACSNDGAGDDAAGFRGSRAGGGGGLEKSAMVCRHWKSKGWCKLEDGCRFMHPEHKRGSSGPLGAESAGPTGAAVRGTPQELAGPAAGGKGAPARSTRRAGRNRHGTSGPGEGGGGGGGARAGAAQATARPLAAGLLPSRASG
eukprot:TRINITY_DN32645_c0_g1_i1.p1 TRINITY_DN32645_c0_g1~~TRINITY_DN32645_c0_g1_i1.p1  ORF type:complete len:444 (+),score=107.41 TRINITY_DN32645_c0_g1_i1:83-1414(+)